MLHQTEPLDTDTEVAVEDVLQTVSELGSVAGRAIRLDPDTPDYRAAVSLIRDRYDMVAARARSACIEPAFLLNTAAERIRRDMGNPRGQGIDIAQFLHNGQGTPGVFA